MDSLVISEDASVRFRDTKENKQMEARVSLEYQ
jgi:hypothetical protein